MQQWNMSPIDARPGCIKEKRNRKGQLNGSLGHAIHGVTGAVGCVAAQYLLLVCKDLHNPAPCLVGCQ